MPRKLGQVTLTMVNGGDFRLDGGAMHGVVPKTLWNRLVSCDEHNRCTYTTNCLLVETCGKRVLIETGNGDKFPPDLKDIYGIDHDRCVAAALRDIGVEPESIDVVVMTHLHFDHSGGATRRDGDRVVPVFPRARHVVQARELVAATHPHERNRASYLAENIEPLREAGLLHTVDGEAEVAPGIRVLPTPGHTPGHQSVLIDGGDEKAVFLGDVVPTAVHVPLPWIMAYDLDVEATLASRKRLYERARAEMWMLLFGHDRHHAAYLEIDDRGRFRAGEPFSL
ncbi:MAG: MBL fold metallo-hydrolase [Deltaproteobacteria bacterium]|nr:MAG: MBL fold metallo-hydrolase [Deltaproteobacteria bacterium]